MKQINFIWVSSSWWTLRERYQYCITSVLSSTDSRFLRFCLLDPSLISTVFSEKQNKCKKPVKNLLLVSEKSSMNLVRHRRRNKLSEKNPNKTVYRLRKKTSLKTELAGKFCSIQWNKKIRLSNFKKVVTISSRFLAEHLETGIWIVGKKEKQVLA